jgi:hypothetical protein
MFRNPHLDRVRQLFTDQFEPDGAGFFYRKSMKGAPIRVSADERDGFVEAFNRRLRYAVWSVLLATVALIVLLALLLPDVDRPGNQAAAYAGFALVMIVFFAIYYWAWNAPARELERRAASGPARTRAEMRGLMLARMSYGYLGLIAAAAVGAMLKLSRDTDILHGWGRLWLLLGAIAVATAGIQAFRKWRLERD